MKGRPAAPGKQSSQAKHPWAAAAGPSTSGGELVEVRPLGLADKPASSVMRLVGSFPTRGH